jgi:hypothetical protein
MEVELPIVADFGVEKQSKQQAAKASMQDSIKRTNREAARLYGEMFSSLATTSVILFPSEEEASTARNIWGPTFRGKVLSIDSPKTKGATNLMSRKYSIEEQEAALLGSDGIYVPDGTEVLVIAGPRAKDWKKIRRITDKLTDETLIVLLNSRATAASLASTKLRGDDDSEMTVGQWISDNYEPVFHYAPPVLPEKVKTDKELLLYHEYGGNWVLAEKNKPKGFVNLGGGGFQTLWEGDARPSTNDLAKAIQ